jgi:hypothetical protein
MIRKCHMQHAAGRIRSIEKSNELIGNRTRNFPACNTVPQPTTLPHASAIQKLQVLKEVEVKLSL